MNSRGNFPKLIAAVSPRCLVPELRLPGGVALHPLWRGTSRAGDVAAQLFRRRSVVRGMTQRDLIGRAVLSERVMPEAPTPLTAYWRAELGHQHDAPGQSRSSALRLDPHPR